VPNRAGTWISLLTFCLVRAFALALAFAIILTGAALAFAGGRQSRPPRKNLQSDEVRVFSGVVTDSYCGAKHTRNASLSSAECVRACIRDGAGYVLVDGDTSYSLQGNTNELAKAAGQRVRVVGSLQGQTINVSSIDTGD
jgi:hypothetical protein